MAVQQPVKKNLDSTTFTYSLVFTHIPATHEKRLQLLPFTYNWFYMYVLVRNLIQKKAVNLFWVITFITPQILVCFIFILPIYCSTFFIVKMFNIVEKVLQILLYINQYAEYRLKKLQTESSDAAILNITKIVMDLSWK